MFDPEFQEDFFMHEKKQTSIRKISRREEDEMLHGEDGSMIYKYDLPVVNEPMKMFN